MEFKAYFVDLDGTLCDGTSSGSFGTMPSNANIDAINETLEKTPVIISTGRSLIDAVEISKLFPSMPYLICGNGAWIFDNVQKKLITEYYLSKSIIQKILFSIESIKSTSFSFQKKQKPKDLFIYGKNIISNILVKHGHKNYVFQKKKDLDSFVGIAKMLIYHTPRKIKALIKIIKALNLDISIVTQGKFSIEITSVGATKGIAAKNICKRIGIDPKNAVHIGDTMNDSTAIEHIGSLIAMKNSKKNLKILATHIGPHYKPHGLSKVLFGEYKKVK